MDKKISSFFGISFDRPVANNLDEITCQSVYYTFVKGMAWLECRFIDGDAWRTTWLTGRIKNGKEEKIRS